MTRPKERIYYICDALERLWNLYPDLRLGQLLEATRIFPVLMTGNGNYLVTWSQEDDLTLNHIKVAIKDANEIHIGSK